MKIIVVEDEIKTLNGIIGLITEIGFDFEVIDKARSAEDGIEMIMSQNPDIVITDIRMKGMSGLDMLRELNRREYRGRYLILSGHAEFQYAKDAITLGSMDYLLKPITRETLEKTLKNVKDVIEMEEQKIHPAAMTTEQILERGLFISNFTESQMENELYKRFSQYNCLYLLVICGENKIVKRDFEQILEKLNGCVKETDFFVCQGGDKKEYYLLFAGNLYQLEETLDQLVAMCRKEINPYVVFTGNRFDHIGKLKEAKEKVLDLTNWSLSMTAPQVITQERIELIEPKRFVYPTEYEHAIINAISDGKIVEVETYLREFQAYLLEQDYMYSAIRESMVCLTVAALYAIRKASYGLYENISNLNVLEWVRNSLFLDTYVRMMMNIVTQYEKYTKNLKTCNHPIINKVIAIIEKEYQCELTLEDMARRMAVTPEYLSGLFMKELGIKYTTYRAQVRIDVAKRLLRKGKLKVYEIAEASGFTDVRYFNKVFKKYTGVSPGEYVRKIISK